MIDFCYEKAKQGDSHDIHRMIEKLHPRISSMASYYARRSGEDADDLAQEAWMGLWEALPDLDIHIGSPDQYLIQRARWRLLDAMKRASTRRYASLEEQTEDQEGRIYPASAFEEACLTEFTGRLKELHRKIVECLLAGFTWREAGVILGCTSANIAYHMRQIRRQYQEWDAH